MADLISTISPKVPTRHHSDSESDSESATLRDTRSAKKNLGGDAKTTLNAIPLDYTVYSIYYLAYCYFMTNVFNVDIASSFVSMLLTLSQDNC